MAIQNLAEIKEILEGRQGNQTQLKKAIAQEYRIRLHTEISQSKADISRAVGPFLKWVESLIPYDKYQFFLSMFKYPVSTVPLAESIFMQHSKMWDGRNPVHKIEFVNPDDLENWSEKRIEIKFDDYFRTEVSQATRGRFNSIMLVDLPSEQAEDTLPEPYFYMLPLENVYKIEMVDNEIDWIFFNTSMKDHIAVFCDGFYRVLKMKEGSRTEIEDIVTEEEHGLNYCPAKFIISTPLDYKEPIVKKSVLSTHSSALDKLLFWMNSNDHLNLYARYPIYSGYTASCKFENEESGHYCEKGWLMNRDSYHVLQLGRPVACPICKVKRLEGAGSYVEVDPPSQRNGNKDLRDPVNVLTIDRESLDYNNEDIATKKKEIFCDVTGYQGAPINDQAVNPKQVTAIFESLENALMIPQGNMEQIMQWTEQTYCLLRYGEDRFISVSRSLGTEHFLLGSEEVMTLYKTALSSNLPSSVLDMLQDLFFATKYKNNPEQLERERILANLYPFRHLTNDQVTKMYSSQSIKFEDYFITVNFSSVVMRFERENIPVTRFGIGQAFDARINNIKAVLNTYALEMRPEESSKPTGEPPEARPGAARPGEPANV